jgi:hypothetical protein
MLIVVTAHQAGSTSRANTSNPTKQQWKRLPTNPHPTKCLGMRCLRIMKCPHMRLQDDSKELVKRVIKIEVFCSHIRTMKLPVSHIGVDLEKRDVPKATVTYIDIPSSSINNQVRHFWDRTQSSIYVQPRCKANKDYAGFAHCNRPVKYLTQLLLM